jgi:hypothetical protein
LGKTKIRINRLTSRIGIFMFSGPVQGPQSCISHFFILTNVSNLPSSMRQLCTKATGFPAVNDVKYWSLLLFLVFLSSPQQMLK